MTTAPITKDKNDKVQTPAYLHQYIPGAFLPLTQSIITAVLIFILAWVLMSVGLDMLYAHKYALLISVCFLVATWFSRQKLWFSLAQWERLVGIDLNRDGRIGDVEVAEYQAPVEIKERRIRIVLDRTENGAYAGSSAFMQPATDEQLRRLAVGILIDGRPFSEPEWTGRGIPFRKIRATFMAQEMVEYADPLAPTQGMILTEKGRQYLENYLPSSPTLDGEVVE